jgi:hypothetical protein
VTKGPDELVIAIQTTADFVGSSSECGVRGEARDRMPIAIRDLACFRAAGQAGCGSSGGGGAKDERCEAREVMVGFDERDLVRWAIAAGFEHVSPRYDLDYSCEPVPAEVIDNRVRGQPNPTMPSFEQAATAVLGDEATAFIEQYRRVLSRQSSTLLRAVAHLTAQRA